MILHHVYICTELDDCELWERSYWTDKSPDELLAETLDFFEEGPPTHQQLIEETFEPQWWELNTSYDTSGYTSADKPRCIWKVDVQGDDQKSNFSIAYGAYEVDPDADKDQMLTMMKGWLSDASPADIRNMIVFLRDRLGK